MDSIYRIELCTSRGFCPCHRSSSDPAGGTPGLAAPCMLEKTLKEGFAPPGLSPLSLVEQASFTRRKGVRACARVRAKGVCATHSRRCAHRPPKLAASLEHNVPGTVGRETRMRAAPSWPPRAQRAPKGTNSRREPPSAPPSAPGLLNSCTPSLVGIKTGPFWYSTALPAAPGAPCALKRSSQPSCPKRLQAR